MKSVHSLFLAFAMTAPVFAADVQAVPAASAESGQAAQHDTTAQAPAADPLDQIICKFLPPPTGSHLGASRVCKKQRQWDEGQEDMRGRFRFELRNAGRSTGTSSGSSN